MKILWFFLDIVLIILKNNVKKDYENDFGIKGYLFYLDLVFGLRNFFFVFVMEIFLLYLLFIYLNI